MFDRKTYAREYRRKQYAKNPEKYRAERKAYYDAHADQEREKARQRYWANVQLRRAQSRLSSRKRQGIEVPTDEIRRGRCPICKKVRVLVYDHDHETGQFRGWLCNGCNLKLGWVEKFFVRIRKYLKEKC